VIRSCRTPLGFAVGRESFPRSTRVAGGCCGPKRCRDGRSSCKPRPLTLPSSMIAALWVVGGAIDYHHGRVSSRQAVTCGIGAAVLQFPNCQSRFPPRRPGNGGQPGWPYASPQRSRSRWCTGIATGGRRTEPFLGPPCRSPSCPSSNTPHTVPSRAGKTGSLSEWSSSNQVVRARGTETGCLAQGSAQDFRAIRRPDPQDCRSCCTPRNIQPGSGEQTRSCFRAAST